MNEGRRPGLRINLATEARSTRQRNCEEYTRLEGEFAQANSWHWRECPAWLKKDVSLLAQFISAEALQKDLLALDQNQGSDALRELMDDRIVDESYIADLVKQAEDDIARKETALAEKHTVAGSVEVATIADEVENWDDDTTPHDYHNPTHDRQVVQRLVKLIRVSEPPLTQQMARVLLMAAAHHDDEHPSGPALVREDLSYEQISVVVADELAVKRGMNIYERTMLATTILGTTFADKIHPTNHVELMLKLADIGGYMESNEEWIKQSLDVPKEAVRACVRGIISKAEIPPYMKAWLDQPDFESARAAWLVGQQNFISYELRPNHNTYKNRYLSRDDWEIDSYLDEKERLVQALQGKTSAAPDMSIAEMTRINETIDRRLLQIWEKYRSLPEVA